MAVVLSDLRNHLEGQLAAKKTALNETEESLRKYVGDRAVENQSRPTVRNRITGPGAVTTGRGGRRSLGDRLGAPDGDDRSEESDVVNKSVMSRVVKDVKSREETIEEQKSDNKVVARNRRMFGALVGTLQKFNKEEIKKKDVMEKKKEVEKNVEEKVEKEKEEIKNKKRELFYEQKKKKKDIQIIQIQMKRVEEYEIWEKSKQCEGNFIRTKAEPEIYWLPKTASDKTKELGQNTKDAVAKEIESKKEEFEEELLAIEKKLSFDQDRGRNGGTGDIRDRLGKVKSLDDSLVDEGDDDDKGFMSDRRIVERENETNGSDLRMTLKNDLAERINKKKDEEEGRQVFVKSEAEVDERKKRKEEEKQKDVEEKRREENRGHDGAEKRPAKTPPVPERAEAAPKRKQKARDSSSDTDEKSKRDSGKKRRLAKSERSSRKEKKSKHESSDSESSSEEERRPKKRDNSSSSESEDEKPRKRRPAREKKRGKSSSSERESRKDKKRSKRESSSEDSSSDSD